MKILITVLGEDVAPRFDLATEVVVAEVQEGRPGEKPRALLLPRASAEELCSLILKEAVTTVICGGIEETHYKYLLWKKIHVVDGVIGPYALALQMAREGGLHAGCILRGAGEETGE